MTTLRSFALISTLIPLACGCGDQRHQPPATGGVRVVSLAPNLTEIVCAVGGTDRLVGRTSACDYPPDAVANVPVIGGFGDPSLERLLEVKPTVILDVDLADQAIARKIEEVGLRRERINCGTLGEIPSAVAEVGRLIGREDEGRTLAAGIRAQVESFRASSPEAGARPRVYVEIWCDPLTTVGRSSYISELVTLAGGTNIGDSVSRDYFEVGPEWVLTQNPEVILCLYMAATGDAREAVMNRSEWNKVSAVKSGRVYDSLDNNLILRPGPRVAQSLAVLRRCIAPSGQPQPSPAAPSGNDLEGAAMRLRAFRFVAALIVGAALSCAGIVLQALLKNPLAEPYVLGVSSGAALGAALAILAGAAAAGAFVIPVVAFLSAGATLAVVYLLSRSGGTPSIYGLVISGVIVSSVCSSILMFAITVAPVEGIHSILWWMLGNLQVTSYPLLEVVGITTLAGIAVIWVMSPELNALTLGREMAHYVGVRTNVAIPVGLAMATLITAAAVSMAGLIGFIGLIVPHVVRSLVGPNHRRLIPAAAVAGGLFLAVCDFAARTIIAPAEVPVGVITALIGGPFFLVILRSRRQQGWIG